MALCSGCSPVWCCVVLCGDVSVSVSVLASPKDPGGQHVGFLLNSLGVTVALTSDTTAKNLPKDDSKDHIVQFKGEGVGGEEGEGGRGRVALPATAVSFNNCSPHVLNDA